MSGLIPHFDPSSTGATSTQAGRLLSVARMLAKFPVLSRRKKQAYSLWIMGYLRYLDRHDLGDPRPRYLRGFLDALSEREDVDRAMRRQAAEALVFFHECVLSQQVGEVHGRVEMMSDDERRQALQRLDGQERLLAQLVFETELDLTEALRLRVGDVDLGQGQIVATDVAGRAQRFVKLDDSLVDRMETHLKALERQHRRDLEEGSGIVNLPPSVQGAFPGAESAWVWQYVFPSEKTTVDLRSGVQRRYPMHPARLLDILNRRTAPMTRVHEDPREVPSDG
jgi:integrase